MDRDDQHAGSTSSPAAAGSREQPGDPLLALRAALDAVDELPLAERAVVFDRTHAVVVEELRSLELT